MDPHNLQAIIGWAMEANRRDMWQADQDTAQKLSDAYIQSATQYGVVCCHHTCANLVFNEWIANYTTVDSDTLNQFKQVFTDATNKELQIQTKFSNSSRKNHSVASSIKKPVDKQQVVPSPDKPSEPPKDAPAPEPNLAGSQPEPAAPVPATTIPRQAGGEAREDQAEAGQSQGSAGESAEQVASRQAGEAGEGEQAGEAAVKGYEIEVKKEKQSSGASRKAVTAFAILGALGAVAVFVKGYLTGPR